MEIANDNNRPASFDARVMAYRPGLWNLAGKLGARGEERQDLVTDTIIEALERWENYREEGGGFWNWLYWTMRGKFTNQRAKHQLPMTKYELEDLEQHLHSKPSQDQYVELSETLSALTAGRNGAILLRRAMGDDLAEIGADLGIGRERVRQIVEMERELVRKRMRVRGQRVAA